MTVGRNSIIIIKSILVLLLYCTYESVVSPVRIEIVFCSLFLDPLPHHVFSASANLCFVWGFLPFLLRIQRVPLKLNVPLLCRIRQALPVRLKALITFQIKVLFSSLLFLCSKEFLRFACSFFGEDFGLLFEASQ